MWKVQLYRAFELEFLELDEEIQDEALAIMLLLQQFGPHLGRPRVDALKGSRHANMKELRSMPRAASGESHSRLILNEKQFF
jgi:hypothetical protein